ncbi:AAA family ATPase [Aliivibrio fischeri]|nr:AAA family ATPase [Aliivibrio fischeri]
MGSLRMVDLYDGNLNAKQISAIEKEGNILLVACPGSGKTRTLAYKIAFELSKLTSKKKFILAITYTNRAANEIEDRVLELGVNTEQLWIGTIHSFCLEWIIKPFSGSHESLRYGYEVIDSYDSDSILKEVCQDIKYVNPFVCNYYYKTDGVHIQCDDYRRKGVILALEKYHQILSDSKCINFEQILYFSYQILERSDAICKVLANLFSNFLIDEYQDTKEIQYGILSKIFLQSNHKIENFIVGDPNQAILASLGGYAISIDELSYKFETKFTQMDLSSNYRSSESIVQFFSKFKVFESPIIAKGKYKKFPSEISYNGNVSKERLIDELVRLIKLSVETHGVEPSEICIVAPWWIHLASITRRLVAELPDYSFDGPGLTPFAHDKDNFWYKLTRIVLSKPSPRRFHRRIRWAQEVITDLISYGFDVNHISAKSLLRLSNSISSDKLNGIDYLKHIFEQMFEVFGIKFQDNEHLYDLYEIFFNSSKERISRISSEDSEYKATISNFEKVFEEREGITISSIHGVKGAEFDVVIAFGLLEGMVPNNNEKSPRESAQKLLYVVASRARKYLYLISEIERYDYKGTEYLPTNELRYIDSSSYTSYLT